MSQEILLVNRQKNDIPMAIIVLSPFVNAICVETNCSIVTAGLQIKHDLIFAEEALFIVIQQEIEVFVEDFDGSTFDEIDVFNFIVETQDCVILLMNLTTYITQQRIYYLLWNLELLTGILEEVPIEI